MSVPLGHRNHKSSRGKSTSPIYLLTKPEPKEKIRIGDFEVSKDSKHFYRLYGIHRENVVLPNKIEDAYLSGFVGSYVKSITLPKSIKFFGSSKNKDVWGYYEAKKKDDPHLGAHYVLTPKIVIVNDNKLLAELQEKVNRKRVPEFLKGFLLKKQDIVRPKIVDSYGAEYIDKGYLYQFPKGLKKYDIPEGVRYSGEHLRDTDIEEILIPSSYVLGTSDLNSPKLRIIHFASPDTYLMSGSMREAVNLEKILVPKGSLEYYTKCFEFFIKHENLKFVIEEY